MARIRSVKPEFWTDEDLAELTRDARLLYIGLWNLADEHGRLRGDPRYVKGQIFPYDDDLPSGAVDELLDDLADAGKITRYRVGSGSYIFLPNLSKHQRLEAGKVPSKLPEPDDPAALPHRPGPAQIRADLSAPRAQVMPSDARTDPGPSQNGPEDAGPDDDGPNGTPSMANSPDLPEGPAQIGADKSAPGADESSLLYGTGSMEHGACNERATSSQRDHSSNSGNGRHLSAVPANERPTPATAPRRNWSNAQIDADPHFAAFWAAYPNKVSKGHARKAWLKAVRDGADPAQITVAAEKFRDKPGRDPRFTAHPATWLNGERWGDQPAEPAPAIYSPRPFWEN